MNFRKLLMALCLGLVLLIIVFAMFPMILEGVDTVNSTTNVTQYMGLTDINNLSPLIIFIGLLAAVASAVWLAATGSGQRFLDNVRRGAQELKDQWKQR